MGVFAEVSVWYRSGAVLAQVFLNRCFRVLHFLASSSFVDFHGTIWGVNNLFVVLKGVLKVCLHQRKDVCLFLK